MINLFSIIVSAIVLIFGFTMCHGMYQKVCEKHKNLVFYLTVIFVGIVWFFALQDLRLVLLALVLYGMLGFIIFIACKTSHHNIDECDCDIQHKNN